MSVGSLLRSFYLLYFSQPATDRALYRAVRSGPVRSIVELGISLTSRTPRLLEIAGWRAASLPLRYTGIDLFESRPPDQPALPLKHAFAGLQSPTVRVQLVPGDPATALGRTANSLVGTDLLIISANQDRDSLVGAWPWLPRMLTPASLIFLEEPAEKSGQSSWRRLTFTDVQRLAAQSKPARRAA
ncbi:MAG: hypothetical protein JF612_06745 [Planctomycetia bacterium]|nr:hypothetical protein [Planctomycetia bacterium]